LFRCPGTSKCISKHRLLDGSVDCYNHTDESYENSCQLNDKHRFSCTSEKKCFSRYIVRNGISHCLGNEDEIPVVEEENISFQKLCNGYTLLAPILIDGKNETDETNCEQWPCNNQYTRCDGAWTCPNGADEINCDPNSRCYPHAHECISPRTFELICLPITRAGDGIIDCLGATDEREHCRQNRPKDVLSRYRCLDETRCSSWKEPPSLQCVDTHYCHNEEYFSFNIHPWWEDRSSVRNCSNHLEMMSVLNKLLDDQILLRYDTLNQIHFTLDHSNQFLSHIQQQSLSQSNQPSILVEKLNVVQNSNCNRGIFIRVGKEKIESCLCPPSYYGNQCQFQSERISLSVKIGKECAPNCYGVYAILLTLIDNQKLIHSYEQLTYIPTQNCDIKFNLYFLYNSRPKDLSKNYSIHIDVYDRIHVS
jgi:hypothetical protein